MPIFWLLQAHASVHTHTNTFKKLNYFEHKCQLDRVQNICYRLKYLLTTTFIWTLAIQNINGCIKVKDNKFKWDHYGGPIMVDQLISLEEEDF